MYGLYRSLGVSLSVEWRAGSKKARPPDRPFRSEPSRVLYFFPQKSGEDVNHESGT
jgi:hypothetical protein